MTDSYIPKKVNPINLAKSAETLSGTVNIARLMPRLKDMLVEGDEPTIMSYELEFGVDAGNRAYVKGFIKGSLEVTCQRCMSPMTLNIDSSFALALVKKSTPESEMPKEYEPLILEADTVVPAEILEDELLLCIPYAPMHEEKCKEDFSSQANDDSSTKADNPFSVLKDL